MLRACSRRGVGRPAGLVDEPRLRCAGRRGSAGCAPAAGGLRSRPGRLRTGAALAAAGPDARPVTPARRAIRRWRRIRPYSLKIVRSTRKPSRKVLRLLSPWMRACSKLATSPMLQAVGRRPDVDQRLDLEAVAPELACRRRAAAASVSGRSSVGTTVRQNAL